MTSPPVAMDTEGPPQPYNETAAQHIRELSELNKQLPALLQTSGTTISLLTNRPATTSTTPPSTLSNPTARKSLITTQTTQFFKSLNTLRQALHAQITLLDQSSIIPAEPTRLITTSTSKDSSSHDNKAGNSDLNDLDEEQKQRLDKEARVLEVNRGVTNGGLGDLDVADLNARAGVSRGGRGRAGEEDVLVRVERGLVGLGKRIGVDVDAALDGREGDDDGEERKMVVDG